MPLAIAIIIIFIGAILVLASVVNPKQISGQGGGMLVNMDELFRGQPGIWRIVGLVLGVVLIAGGAVGSSVEFSPDSDLQGDDTSPLSSPTTEVVTSSTPTSMPVDSAPTFIPSTPNLTTASSCLELPVAHMASLEAGQFDVPIIEASSSDDGSIALRLTDTRVVVGYVLFDFIPGRGSAVFKIATVTDSACRPINSYMPLEVRTNQKTIQNWDDLCIRFAQEFYSINFGWEDTPWLEVDFKDLSDRSEPTQQACASAIGRN